MEWNAMVFTFYAAYFLHNDGYKIAWLLNGVVIKVNNKRNCRKLSTIDFNKKPSTLFTLE